MGGVISIGLDKATYARIGNESLDREEFSTRKSCTVGLGRETGLGRGTWLQHSNQDHRLAERAPETTNC